MELRHLRYFIAAAEEVNSRENWANWPEQSHAWSSQMAVRPFATQKLMRR
jgi:hypothetical protein